MPFSNPGKDAIADLLRSARTIAVVGLSDNPRRPSYEVASALLDFGYTVVPVNPHLAVWEGIRAAPDLDQALAALSPHRSLDIVNVFRHPRYVAAVVDDCIRLKVRAIWLQLGVVDEAAAQRAVQANMTVVMNRCIKVDRTRMG